MLQGLLFLLSLKRRDDFLRLGGKSCRERGKSEGHIRGEERKERLWLNYEGLNYVEIRRL